MKFLDINTQSSYCTTSHKWGLEYLYEDTSVISQAKKKDKSSLLENKLYYKYITRLFKMLLPKNNI